MRYLLIILALNFVIATNGCNSKPPVKTENNSPVNAYPLPHIIIKLGTHAEFDLKENIYKVRFTGKPAMIIPFSISDSERMEIIAKFNQLSLEDIKAEEKFVDSCYNMPEILTTLVLSGLNSVQTLKIDIDCNVFEKQNGYEIKDFILFIVKMLRRKPEIANAPKSDIGYM